MLTLSEAIKQRRLDEFVRQEEARGVGPVSKRKLNAAIKAVATKPPRSEDQTSRSASRGGSNGK
jgi:hypothetical protein